MNFVQKFYDWYIAYPGDALKDAKMDTYVHPETLKDLHEHRWRIAANGGEPVGYDANYFLHAQDVPSKAIIDKKVFSDESCNGCIKAVTASLFWSDQITRLLVVLENDHRGGGLRIRKVLTDYRP
ncbi:MAG: YbjP/YqhG family protein [Azoarcus sp.]|nr:YbjP/YqhG family protein [Azoarcus sp.]